MILALEPAVAERMAEIEYMEGISPAAQAHQAVDAWSHLRGEDERRMATIAILQIVIARHRTGGEK